MNIGIYLYEHAEVLDFSGPFEVFATAARFNDAIKPLLISERGGLVSARAGYQVMANHSIADHPPLDVLIVVGGIHSQEQFNAPVLNWIAEQANHVKLMCSVCTGAFLLAQAGVITDQQVTTHWEDLKDLQEQFIHLKVVGNVRWVEQGDIITSAGISAGIDMSLHLISRLYDEQLAEKTAKQMDFSWTKNN